MTEADFDYLRALLKDRSGLDLGSEKQYLAESRLAPVCREAGMADVTELVERLRRRGDQDLVRRVVEAMTTNETMFFRDRSVFASLGETIIPGLIRARAATRRLRIWSAASSSGQEAYSVAMLLDEMGLTSQGWRIEILATDIADGMIARGRAGLYSHFEVQRGLPIRHLVRHFTDTGKGWQISERMRSLIEFRPFNLLGNRTPFGPFDLVLCRNILIYFDSATKAAVLDRIAGSLAEGGVLCLGTAESVTGLTARLAPDPEARGFFIPSGPGAMPTSRHPETPVRAGEAAAAPRR